MIKVLVVDDSAIVRQVFRKELSRDPDIDVVGAAQDAYEARDMIVELHPDVVTLDIEMPRMDGLTFLRKIMRYSPLPVIIVSSLTPKGGDLALDALKLGAVEVMGKPAPGYSWEQMAAELAENVKAAATVKVQQITEQPSSPAKGCSAPPLAEPARKLAVSGDVVVAIGGSTGATIAIEGILQALPTDSPGVLITQHMPEIFTSRFAERLNAVTSLQVREAQDGAAVVPGEVLVAPGNRHLLLRGTASGYHVNVKHGPLVNRHRPSVDVMFRSVAKSAGKNGVGVILTGMGKDGAQGLLEMRRAGAATIGQDEESSVVFGMPKAAIALDAVDEVVSLQHIPAHILRFCSR